MGEINTSANPTPESSAGGYQLHLTEKWSSAPDAGSLTSFGGHVTGEKDNGVFWNASAYTPGGNQPSFFLKEGTSFRYGPVVFGRQQLQPGYGAPENIDGIQVDVPLFHGLDLALAGGALVEHCDTQDSPLGTHDGWFAGGKLYASTLNNHLLLRTGFEVETPSSADKETSGAVLAGAQVNFPYVFVATNLKANPQNLDQTNADAFGQLSLGNWALDASARHVVADGNISPTATLFEANPTFARNVYASNLTWTRVGPSVFFRGGAGATMEPEVDTVTSAVTATISGIPTVDKIMPALTLTGRWNTGPQSYAEGIIDGTLPLGEEQETIARIYLASACETNGKKACSTQANTALIKKFLRKKVEVRGQAGITAGDQQKLDSNFGLAVGVSTQKNNARLAALSPSGSSNESAAPIGASVSFKDPSHRGALKVKNHTHDPINPEHQVAYNIMGLAWGYMKHATQKPEACEPCHTPAYDQQGGYRNLMPQMKDTCASTGCHDTAHITADEEGCGKCHSWDEGTPVSRFNKVVYHPPRHTWVLCSDCHPVINGNPVKPSPADVFCVDCHKKYFKHTPTWRKSHPVSSNTELKKCLTCHGEDEENLAVDGPPLCSACHGVLHPETAFSSKEGNHPAGWVTENGGLHTKWAPIQIVQCAGCHTQLASCRNCHEEQKRTPSTIPDGEQHHPQGWINDNTSNFHGKHVNKAEVAVCGACHIQNQCTEKCHVEAAAIIQPATSALREASFVSPTGKPTLTPQERLKAIQFLTNLHNKNK